MANGAAGERVLAPIATTADRSHHDVYSVISTEASHGGFSRRLLTEASHGGFSRRLLTEASHGGFSRMRGASSLPRRPTTAAATAAAAAGTGLDESLQLGRVAAAPRAGRREPPARAALVAEEFVAPAGEVLLEDIA